MCIYSFTILKLIHGAKLFNDKITIKLSSYEEVNFCAKIIRWPNNFQEPMSNSPLLLNYLCFGVRSLEEPRLITEVFILALWLGCVLLP